MYLSISPLNNTRGQVQKLTNNGSNEQNCNRMSQVMKSLNYSKRGGDLEGLILVTNMVPLKKYIYILNESKQIRE